MKPLSRLLTAVLAPLAVLVLAGAPAAAHGGPGEMEITSITRDGDDVTVAVRLIFTGDGDGVPDATVTVVVDDGTPVPMEAGTEEGDYQATVTAAEGATIRVTSVEPPTTAEGTAPAADETATTEAGSTTTADETTTEAPATTEADATTTPTPVPDEVTSDDDGGISPVVIGAVVAVVLAAIAMAVILLGKKKPSADES